MKYAPIIIPTLSRFEHFQRLIESLKKNSWARFTDIFISVDFPPEEKYVHGRDQIISYLESNIFEEFKSINCFIQDKNLGPYGNILFLINCIRNQGFDRYIILEDDNETSLNFIEYFDKGLDLFQNHPEVCGICGNDRVIVGNEVIDHGPGNYRFSSNMTYAYGTWLYIWDDINNRCSKGYFHNASKSIKLMKKLIIKNAGWYRRYVLDLLYRNPVYYYNEQLFPIDTVVNIYNIFTDKFFVVPNVPKVRNYGFDGSGVGKVVQDSVRLGFTQQLDSETFFEFDDHEATLDVLENKQVSKWAKGKKHSLLIFIIMNCLYVIWGEKAVHFEKKLLNKKLAINKFFQKV